MFLDILFCNVVTVRNDERCFIGICRFINLVAAFSQIELDGSIDRNPLGIEDYVAGGHLVTIQLIFIAGALRVLIPAAELDRAGLVCARYFGYIILVGAQRSLELDGFGLHIAVLVIESQLV